MKKIMFDDRYSLTQAVLDGRKTQLRQLVPDELFTLTWDQQGDTLVYENDFGDFIDIRQSKYARYKVGEIVAVAQRYQDIFDYSNCVNPYAWEDDDKPSGWTNKMLVKAELMPHRIRMTGISVERLQDISDENCLKEGVIKNYEGMRYGYDIYTYSINDLNEYAISPQGAFRTLISGVIGRKTWQSNPWVFAYEFELMR